MSHLCQTYRFNDRGMENIMMFDGKALIFACGCWMGIPPSTGQCENHAKQLAEIKRARETP